MYDDPSSDNINIRTGANLPKVGRQRNAARPVIADIDVADVAKMEFAFTPLAVRCVGGIPMPARRCSVGGAAIAVLVNMNGMGPGRSALDFNDKLNLTPHLCESRRAGQVISARRSYHRNRLRHDTVFKQLESPILDHQHHRFADRLAVGVEREPSRGGIRRQLLPERHGSTRNPALRPPLRVIL